MSKAKKSFDDNNEDNDVDIESNQSDFDDYYDDPSNPEFAKMPEKWESWTAVEKRAHHNTLERQRRDSIKASFIGLRDAIPTLKDGRIAKSSKTSSQASRAKILQEATDYIRDMKSQNVKAQNNINDMRRKNESLEEEIRKLERMNGAASFRGQYQDDKSSSSVESFEVEDVKYLKQRKKMKMNHK